MKSILISGIFCTLFFYACKEKPTDIENEVFESQSTLDSLKNGSINYGNEEVNQAMIRVLNFQKKFKTGKTNGVVLPKSMISQTINGFDENGIILPIDASNYDKWDFLVIYPGLAINEQGEEKSEPSVFFYKGTQNASGDLIPTGKPVLDIKFKGGGGGPGDGAKSSPPPTLP